QWSLQGQQKEPGIPRSGHGAVQRVCCGCDRQPAQGRQSPPSLGSPLLQNSAMIIIPSIDLREGRVVRLQQGDYNRQLNYPVDPIATATQFAAAGASWMHIVDLDGAKRGMPVQTVMIGQII